MIKYISFSSDFYKGRKATQQRHQRQKNVNLNYTFIKAVQPTAFTKTHTNYFINLFIQQKFGIVLVFGFGNCLVSLINQHYGIAVLFQFSNPKQTKDVAAYFFQLST